MGCCGRGSLLFLAVAVAGLAYLAYVPVPEAFENPWEIRPIIWTTKLGPYMFWIGEKLGYGTELEQLRALFEKMGDMVPPDPDSTVKVTKTEFSGVNVRVYDPASNTGRSRPAYIFLHGGGWTIGSPANYDDITRGLAEKLGMVVVSVDYRLAPTHKYPAAFEDCLTVTLYLLENAAQYNVDPGRVAIGGDSAGGNLAAAVSLKLRDIKVSPTLKQQVLIYPFLQAIDLQLPSVQQNDKVGLALTSSLMAKFLLAYTLGPAWSNRDNLNLTFNNQHLSEKTLVKGRKLVHARFLEEKYVPKEYKLYTQQGPEKPPISEEFERVVTDPYFAPIMAESLQGVPEACLITAEYDILRDDGLLYKRLLEKARVKVAHYHHQTFHGVYRPDTRNMKMRKEIDIDVEGCLKRL